MHRKLLAQTEHVKTKTKGYDRISSCTALHPAWQQCILYLLCRFDNNFLDSTMGINKFSIVQWQEIFSSSLQFSPALVEQDVQAETLTLCTAATSGSVFTDTDLFLAPSAQRLNQTTNAHLELRWRNWKLGLINVDDYTNSRTLVSRMGCIVSGLEKHLYKGNSFCKALNPHKTILILHT